MEEKKCIDELLLDSFDKETKKLYIEAFILPTLGIYPIKLIKQILSRLPSRDGHAKKMEESY